MEFFDQPYKKKHEHHRSLEAKANSLLKAQKGRRGKKRKRINIPSMPYKTYIKSRFWHKRKQRYFSKFGRLCAVCGKKRGVTLHHKRYDRKLYGQEPDNHLVALCAKHHHEFHANCELKGDMVKATDEFVQTMRQLQNSNIDDLSWI